MTTRDFKKELLSIIASIHNLSEERGYYTDKKTREELSESIDDAFGSVEDLLDKIEFIKFKGASD